MGTAGWWLFFTAFAGLVGSFVAGYTTDKWGRRITLCYLGVVAALGGLILYLTWSSLISSFLILISNVLIILWVKWRFRFRVVI